MATVLTDDFETGFAHGHRWRGIDGLRDFLSEREGFFGEDHELKEILAITPEGGAAVEVKTRLQFFLRRSEPPSPTSEEFTSRR